MEKTKKNKNDNKFKKINSFLNLYLITITFFLIINYLIVLYLNLWVNTIIFKVIMLILLLLTIL